MKSTRINLIILTIGLSLLACCTVINNRKYFDLKNNSNNPIYFGLSYSYPDTSLVNISNIPNAGYKIFPGRTEAAPLGLFVQNPTLQIFIFDDTVIESTPWDTIVKYNMVLKRYLFTESELKNMNWIISYDGN